MAVGTLDNVLVCSVADGVSQSEESHLGAMIAARYAASWPRLTAVLSDPSLRSLDCSEIASIMNFQAAQRAVSPHSLSTTLVVAVVGAPKDGAWPVVVAQIGDSPSLLLRGRQWVTITADDNDSEQAYATSRTRALPGHAKAKVWTVEAIEGDVLVLASDGVGNPIADLPQYAESIACAWVDSPPMPSELLRIVDAELPTYDDDRTLLGIRFGDSGSSIDRENVAS